MNRIGKHIWNYCLLFLPLIFLQFGGYTQDWVDEHENLVPRDVEVFLNAGLTSYYGDLSIYDNNFYNKLIHESGMAMGIVVTKRLTPQFAVSGQLIAGKLLGKKDNTSFESSLFEYNLHVRINPIRLFSYNQSSKFTWDILFGFGNFLFKSTKTEFLEGENRITEHAARVPELVYFVGSGVSYKFNEKMSIGAEISVHQFQNDKIDIVVANSNFDYFSYLNVGFTYYLRSFQKTAPRNKARVAHSDERLKPLDD